MSDNIGIEAWLNDLARKTVRLTHGEFSMELVTHLETQLSEILADPRFLIANRALTLIQSLSDDMPLGKKQSLIKNSLLELLAEQDDSSSAIEQPSERPEADVRFGLSLGQHHYSLGFGRKVPKKSI